MKLSDTEAKFIQALLQNTAGPINAEWDKVAKALDLKDAKCAKERWRQISIRHGFKPASATGVKKVIVRRSAAATKVATNKADTKDVSATEATPQTTPPKPLASMSPAPQNSASKQTVVKKEDEIYEDDTATAPRELRNLLEESESESEISEEE